MASVTATSTTSTTAASSDVKCTGAKASPQPPPYTRDDDNNSNVGAGDGVVVSQRVDPFARGLGTRVVVTVPAPQHDDDDDDYIDTSDCVIVVATVRWLKRAERFCITVYNNEITETVTRFTRPSDASFPLLLAQPYKSSTVTYSVAASFNIYDPVPVVLTNARCLHPSTLSAKLYVDYNTAATDVGADASSERENAGASMFTTTNGQASGFEETVSALRALFGILRGLESLTEPLFRSTTTKTTTVVTKNAEDASK